MRALVTGGAGFVGSHLCDRLLADGHEVICFDSLLTGDRSNLQGLEGRAGFTFRSCDVTEYLDVGARVDAVLHLASAASPVDYLEHPIETLRAGSLGTLNCLGVARAHRAVFLLASTSEAYGDPLVHPQPECFWGNVNPVWPRT